MQQHLYLGPDGVVGRRGSKQIRRADAVSVHLLTAAEADAVVQARANGTDPPVGSRVVPLTPAGLAHVLDDLDLNPSTALLLYRVATDFRAFLDLWMFRAEGRPPQTLGPVLWPSQKRYAEAAIENPRVFYGKARQLGCTELAAAYAGWRLRFGPTASRVHLLSVRDDEARELLEQVRFGVDSVPKWMRLPVERDTQTRVTYRASPDDRRVLASYPASRTTSRSSTCTHLLVDEWDQMPDPERVMASVEPTVAPQGTFHILTTIVAPESPAATYWRRCEDGDGAHVPIFVPALERPDRDDAWLAEKRRSMPASRFLREYPQTPEEMLAAGGDRFFGDEDVDDSAIDTLGLKTYERGHRYLISVDVGRTRDATVILVLDHTEEVVDVVQGHRLVNIPFPEQRLLVERTARDYRAPVVIEANGPGVAFAESLDIPAERIHQFVTTGRSKPVALEKTWSLLRDRCLKFPHDDLPWLAEELRGYAIPDTHIRQDAVMALCSASPPSMTPESIALVAALCR